VLLDVNQEARNLIAGKLESQPDVVVFDFLHSAVLAPDQLKCPSVLFTHNVESEIFRRHRDTVANPIKRAFWASQLAKMEAFEARSLRRFRRVVAVSQRDAQAFAERFEVSDAVVVSTGVDLDYFGQVDPMRSRDVVFCGSMDWLANQDAMRYFLDEIWPLVVARVPDARMTVVGRAPPDSLLMEVSKRSQSWRFTGFVDDVRPFMQGAAVSVVPLRIGGGTRLKVYESMAMGIPVVSTTVGVEGLPVKSGVNCQIADAPAEFADSVVGLLTNGPQRQQMSRMARDYVEMYCGYQHAARQFEQACLDALTKAGTMRIS
jgi:glycosyltransferase involved in cell wall biosynthesis